jgi:hypothetical protein
MGKPRRRYVVCIQTEGMEDLELRKLYEVLEDEAAGSRGYLRVVDETGEDYLYPMELFAPVQVPETTERALATALTARSGRVRQLARAAAAGERRG